jgi:hypothetical protein
MSIPDETERAFARAIAAEASQSSPAELEEAIAVGFAIQRDAIVGSALTVLRGLADLIENRITVDVVRRNPEQAIQVIVGSIRSAEQVFGQ